MAKPQALSYFTDMTRVSGTSYKPISIPGDLALVHGHATTINVTWYYGCTWTKHKREEVLLYFMLNSLLHELLIKKLGSVLSLYTIKMM